MLLEENLAETAEAKAGDGIGWRVLLMFIGGGAVVLAIVVALMSWVINGVLAG